MIEYYYFKYADSKTPKWIREWLGSRKCHNKQPWHNAFRKAVDDILSTKGYIPSTDLTVPLGLPKGKTCEQAMYEIRSIEIKLLKLDAANILEVRDREIFIKIPNIPETTMFVLKHTQDTK